MRDKTAKYKMKAKWKGPILMKYNREKDDKYKKLNKLMAK